MENLLWFLVVAVGPLLLAAAMVYALLRKRRLSREEKIRRDKKTAELFTEEGGGT
ncbi:hypothetical protein PZ897_14430 [Hoeflea sp. YIM 152468]|uniref:hypothetical protein n=1 Tax=Hoeflea sp. YIM 152468 TaxID=3031759 RepID=UPI0023DA0EDA|nr:hypothetical protein [Hoeflea sp. YIM 152468]MDF1609378.1 hypothetical protein [Hoeflea sp. YIM 152468]